MGIPKADARLDLPNDWAWGFWTWGLDLPVVPDGYWTVWNPVQIFSPTAREYKEPHEGGRLSEFYDVKLICGSMGRRLVLRDNGTLWSWGFDGWPIDPKFGYGSRGPLGRDLDAADDLFPPSNVNSGGGDYWRSGIAPRRIMIEGNGITGDGMGAEDEDRDFVEVQCGYTAAIARCADHTVWFWGELYGACYGGANDGSIPPQPYDRGWPFRLVGTPPYDGDPPNWKPQRITSLEGGSPVTQISLLGNHIVVLREDGTVAELGYVARIDSQAEPGGWEGRRTDEADCRSACYRAEPQVVPGLSNIRQVCAGPSYGLAVEDNGKVWIWGRFYDTDLMTPAPPDVMAPREIPFPTKIAKVSTDGQAVMAIDKRGRLWAWGMNYSGVFGFDDEYRGNGLSDYFHMEAVRIPDLENVSDVYFSTWGGNVFALASPVQKKVTGLVATARNQEVELAWDVYPSASHYKVYRCLPQSPGDQEDLSKYDEIGTANGNSYADEHSDPDNPIINGTTYYYVVSAVVNGVETDKSWEVSATPLSPPGSDIGLTAASQCRAVKLSWAAPTVDATHGVAQHYRVERSTDNVTFFTKHFCAAGTTAYADDTTLSGTPYYYRVTAINSAGESAGVVTGPVGIGGSCAAAPFIANAWRQNRWFEYKKVKTFFTAFNGPIIANDVKNLGLADVTVVSATVHDLTGAQLRSGVEGTDYFVGNSGGMVTVTITANSALICNSTEKLRIGYTFNSADPSAGDYEAATLCWQTPAGGWGTGTLEGFRVHYRYSYRGRPFGPMYSRDITIAEADNDAQRYNDSETSVECFSYTWPTSGLNCYASVAAIVDGQEGELSVEVGPLAINGSSYEWTGTLTAIPGFEQVYLEWPDSEYLCEYLVKTTALRPGSNPEDQTWINSDAWDVLSPGPADARYWDTGLKLEDNDTAGIGLKPTAFSPADIRNVSGLVARLYPTVPNLRDAVSARVWNRLVNEQLTENDLDLNDGASVVRKRLARKLTAVVQHGEIVFNLSEVGLVDADLSTRTRDLLKEGSDGTWTAKTSMGTSRHSHTATLLTDGRVLVVGGNSSAGGVLTSTEVYDPVANTWTPKQPLATARSHHSATLLGDGKVLVVGGENGSGNALSSVELYDPVANTWASITPLTTARSHHTATLLADRQTVVIAGGKDGNNVIAAGSGAEVYFYNPQDPGSSSSYQITMGAGRYSHTATLLADGRVLVAGGTGSGGSALSSAEVYDPPAWQWTTADSLTAARHSHTATLLMSGKVLVMGGKAGSTILTSCEVYDPADDSWTGTDALAAARDSHTATLRSNGKVLVVGGNGTGGTTLSSAELYDPETEEWTTTDSLAAARHSHTATLLLDGSLLVTGGKAGNTVLSSSAAYNAPTYSGTYDLATLNRLLLEDAYRAELARFHEPSPAEFVSGDIKKDNISWFVNHLANSSDLLAAALWSRLQQLGLDDITGYTPQTDTLGWSRVVAAALTEAIQWRNGQNQPEVLLSETDFASMDGMLGPTVPMFTPRTKQMFGQRNSLTADEVVLLNRLLIEEAWSHYSYYPFVETLGAFKYYVVEATECGNTTTTFSDWVAARPGTDASHQPDATLGFSALASPYNGMINIEWSFYRDFTDNTTDDVLDLQCARPLVGQVVRKRSGSADLIGIKDTHYTVDSAAGTVTILAAFQVLSTDTIHVNFAPGDAGANWQFSLEREAGSTGQYERITETGFGLAYLDEEVINDQTYTYRVTAFDQNYNRLQAVTAAVIPGDSSTLVLVATAGNSFVDLDWSAVRAASYEVKHALSEDGPWDSLAVLNNGNAYGNPPHTYRHLSAQNGIEHHYQVFATPPTGGKRIESNKTSATPSPALRPLPPDGFRAEWIAGGAAGRAHLTWQARNGVAYYQVFLRDQTRLIPLDSKSVTEQTRITSKAFKTAITGASGGTFTVNGQTVTLAATDTLEAVFDKINIADANLTASYDAASGKITITHSSGGAITVADGTSNFISAMHLGNGTGTTTSTEAIGVAYFLGTSATYDVPVGTVAGTVFTFAIRSVSMPDAVTTLTSDLKETSLTYDPPGGIDEDITVRLKVAGLLPSSTIEFNGPTNVALEVDASLPNVNRITFYADNEILEVVESEPYQTTWFHVPGGPHTLRASVEVVEGIRGVDAKTTTYNTADVEISVKVKPDLAAYRTSVTDLHLPAPGLPIALLRAYDSRDSATDNSDFAMRGWKANWQVASVKVAYNLGLEWKGVYSELFGQIPRYYFGEAAETHHVVVTLPDGQTLHFAPQLNYYPDATPDLYSLDGATISMTFKGFQPNQGALSCDLQALSVICSTYPQGEAWNNNPVKFGSENGVMPASFSYTAPDGTRYDFEKTPGGPMDYRLKTITDRKNNSLTYMYYAGVGPKNGKVIEIRHSCGRAIGFDYQTAGGTSTISVYDAVSPEGAGAKPVVVYTIDNIEHVLTAVKRLTVREEPDLSKAYETTTYEHGTTDDADPDYDPDNAGRLTDVYDARGVRTLHNDYQSAANEETAGTLLRQTDAAQRETEYVLDENNKLTILRRWHNGVEEVTRTMVVNHDPSGAISEALEPTDTETPSAKTTYEYDQYGRVIAQTTESDGVSVTKTFEYNEKGQLVKRSDELENSRSLEVDDFGEVTSFTDANDHTATFTYDVEGNPLKLTDPVLTETEYTYYKPITAQVSGKTVSLPRLVESERRTAWGVPYTIVTKYTYDVTGDIRGDVVKKTEEWEDGNPNRKPVEIIYDYDRNGNRTAEIRSRTITVNNQEATEFICTVYICDAQNRVTNTSVKVTTTAQGQNQTVTDWITAAGVWTKLKETTRVYDRHGRVVISTDEMNRITRSVYDFAGNLIETESPDHTVTRTSYDAFDRPEYVQDRVRLAGDGTTTTAPATKTTYDASGRVIKVERLSTLTLQKQSANGATTPGAGVDYIRRDTDYEPQAKMVPSAPGTVLSVMRTSYDGFGREQYSMDERGIVTEYAYDAIGRRTNSTVHATSIELDADDLTPPCKAGTPPTCSDPNCMRTTYRYDANGNLKWVKDALNHQTDFEYDEANRRTRVIFPQTSGTSRASATTVYDGLGRHIWTTDENSISTAYSYDFRGLLTSVTVAAGEDEQATTVYTYDEVGNLIAQTDAEDKRDLPRTTRFEYDGVGRRIARILPGGLTETHTYSTLDDTVDPRDPVGSPAVKLLRKTIKDFNDRVITITPDRMGRTATKALPEVRLPDNTLVIAATTVTSAYEKSSGRTAQVAQSGGVNRTVRYAYDTKGLLRVKQTPEGTLSHTYNDYGDITTISSKYTYTWPAMNSDGGYLYDSTFEASRVTNNPNGAEWNYRYDQFGRLVKVNPDSAAQNAPADVTYEFDLVGNLKTATSRNNLVTTYTYNERNWLRMQETKLNTSTLARFDHDQAEPGAPAWPAERRLSDVGQRRRLVELLNGVSRTIDYDYDNLRRLVKENVDASGTSSDFAVRYDVYTPNSTTEGYDKVGNRRSRTVTGETAVLNTLAAAGLTTFNDNGQASHKFDANDLLLGSNPLSPNPQYDNNGNTTSYKPTSSSPTASYFYDAENRLIKQTGNGPDVTIVYDDAGNRVSKTVGTTTTTYLVDDQNLTGYAQVVEERQSGSPTVVYTYGLELISQKRGSTVRYYGYDGLGSVRFLTDGTSGQVTDTYTYDAFGILIAQTPSTGQTINNYRYTGQQWDDDLDMYYLRARYYRPELGRFWTMDSFEGRQADPLSLHKYLYCQGNPVNGIDPSGHEFTLLSLAMSTTIAASLDAIYNGVVSGIGVALQMTIYGVQAGKSQNEILTEFILDQTGIQTAIDIAEMGADLWQKASGWLMGHGGTDETLAMAEFNAAFDTYILPWFLTDDEEAFGVIDEIFSSQCLMAGTLIETSEGLRPIEKVRKGDLVWAWDEQAGERQLRLVADAFTAKRDQLVVIVTDGCAVVATPDHPFFMQNKAWKQARELVAGDALFDESNPEGNRVLTIAKYHQNCTVYNMEVEGLHNYFVTGEGVLTHNIGRGYNHYFQNSFAKAASATGKGIRYGKAALGKARLLSKAAHTAFHADFNDYLEKVVQMRPGRGRPSSQIVKNMSIDEIAAKFRPFFEKPTKYMKNVQKLPADELAKMEVHYKKWIELFDAEVAAIKAGKTAVQ